MKILDNNYYYLTDRFKSKNGDIWKLTGTESKNYYAKNAIDTFVNMRTRQYYDIERIELYALQEKGRVVGVD